VSDYTDRIAKYRKGLFDNAADAVHTDAIRHDRFDAAMWDEMKGKSAPLREQIHNTSLYHDYVEDLFHDVFNGAIKSEPERRPRAEMKPSHQPNNAMMEALLNSKEMERLRQFTVGDKFSATMGTIGMSDTINEVIEDFEAARAAAEAAQALRDALEQAMQDAMDAAEAADANPGDEGAAAGADMAYESMLDTGQQAQQAQQQADEAAGEAVNSQALAKAAGEAADQQQKDADLASGFGMDDGTLQKMSFEERYELAEKLRGSRLADFAAMIGQFRAMAAAESRKKIKHVPDEATKIKLGDDLARLVPQELLNLADEATEDDFYLRYVERRLLVWEMTGTEHVGRGPIIFCNDESGSMGTCDMANGTSREAWSKAFALSMCDQAMREGRDFIYIGFSSRHQVWAQEFPEGKAPIDQVIDMTEHFYSGGTAFEEPLLKAIDYVNQYAAAGMDRTPDVVFCTDDDYPNSFDEGFMHKWLEAKDRTQMRCFGVAMHVPMGENSALVNIADDVSLLSDLANNPTDVARLFRIV
jgi:uncharacterized protein with von Willebrand factor type A (vWA) domain